MKYIRAYSPSSSDKPRRGAFLSRSSENDSLQNSPYSAVTRVLQTILDNSFALITDSPLLGGDTPPPLTLLGPAGIYLLWQNASRGLFRASAAQWEQMDDNRRQFRPAQPNPIQSALQTAKDVHQALSEQGFGQVEIQPVVIFTHPGIHLELDQPAVRLLPLEGLGRFALALTHTPPVLTEKDIETLISLFAPLTVDEVKAAREIKDEFSFKEEQPQKIKIPEINLPLPKDEKIVTAIHKVPFSTRQLLILAALVVVNLLILIGLVLVILIFS